MKFVLKLNPNAEEVITAEVHEQSTLVREIERMVMQHNGEDKVIAYTEDGAEYLPYERIECIFVSGGKTYAVDTQGRRLRLKYRLYELEKQLPVGFIKINKSAVANIEQVKRFTAAVSTAVNCEFNSGYSDYVSRRCFQEIKRRILK